MNLRNDWAREEIQALYEQPFLDLVFEAQRIHREHFTANAIQVSTLLSIKTGKCPEDCKYCPQSGHYNTGLDKEKLLEVQKVLEAAAEAKAIGSTRFCMGAAWKHPTAKDMPYVLKMVEGVKALGVGVVFSFIGTMLSIAALVFIAPTLAKMALSFGPHEYFAIAIFSLTLIITLASGSMVKGIFSGVVGFAFSTVGIAPVGIAPVGVRLSAGAVRRPASARSSAEPSWARGRPGSAASASVVMMASVWPEP